MRKLALYKERLPSSVALQPIRVKETRSITALTLIGVLYSVGDLEMNGNFPAHVVLNSEVNDTVLLVM